MTRKCMGCGSILQVDNKDNIGYTPDINNNLCMRCFKLKHYGKLINKGKIQDNEQLINKINKKNCYVIFVSDFLNIYSNVIEVYKKIKCNKCLVITKSDLIPRNIIKDKLKKNIKRVYDIEEDVILVSSESKENIHVIRDILTRERNVVISGFTNMGKSSLINTLLNKDITVSKSVNTTQEFIKINDNNNLVIDAPGFMNNYYNDVVSKKIRPITYQIACKYCIHINDIVISSNVANDVTIYMNYKLDISKRRIRGVLDYTVKVCAGSDLVIKGLGFIKFSKECLVAINIGDYEIRPSIIGGTYED